MLKFIILMGLLLMKFGASSIEGREDLSEGGLLYLTKFFVVPS